MPKRVLIRGLAVTGPVLPAKLAPITESVERPDSCFSQPWLVFAKNEWILIDVTAQPT